jgi:hypothetical protein
LAEAGQLERAIEVAEMIDDPIERLQALAAIMAAKRKAGKGEEGNGEGMKRGSKGSRKRVKR